MARIRTTGVPASYCKTHGSPPSDDSKDSKDSDVSVNITGSPLRRDIWVPSTWNRR